MALPPHPCTEDPAALAGWLRGCGMDVVALESMGVYWIPPFEALGRMALDKNDQTPTSAALAYPRNSPTNRPVSSSPNPGT